MKATSVAFVVYGPMDKIFHFYIIYSPSLDQFYLGHTGVNLAERLRRHNSNHKGFTGKAKDWVVVHTEIFLTKSEAYARERQVKGWKSRKGILHLIAQLVQSIPP